jgi:hypothetical protein
MTPADYLDRRNAYAYPAVGLTGTCAEFHARDFASLRAMEDYHQDLLRSPIEERAVFGYLSVLYWGHYSGKDQVKRGPRALGKVRLAMTGTDRQRKGRIERMRGIEDIGITVAADVVCEAARLIDRSQFGQALKALRELPQLNFAFASKVCAFLCPERCGVIDSVIAKKHSQFGFAVDSGGYVRRNNTNATTYTDYCEFLSRKGAWLNSIGEEFKWQDIEMARAILGGQSMSSALSTEAKSRLRPTPPSRSCSNGSRILHNYLRLRMRWHRGSLAARGACRHR